MDHRQRCQVDRCRPAEAWLDHLWLRLLFERHRLVRVQRGGGGFRVGPSSLRRRLLLIRLCSLLSSLLAGRGRPLFCGAGSLLSRGIVLREALFSSLHLPVIVPHTPPVHDHPTAELSEHAPRSDDRDLSRAVRVGEQLLLDQIVLLGLGCNDLEQRSIFVEQQIRIPISKDSSAFGRQHEELVPSVRHMEGPAPIFSPAQKVARHHHFFITRIVRFARDVFILFRSQLVGGMVPHGGQRFDRGRFWGRRFGRGGKGDGCVLDLRSSNRRLR